MDDPTITPAMPQTLTLDGPLTPDAAQSEHEEQNKQVSVLFPPTDAHPGGPVVVFPTLAHAHEHAPSVWQQLLAETRREL
jgi:hypothetical protein